MSRIAGFYPAAAAWLAFMMGLIAGGEVEDPASFAIGAAIGAALVLPGLAAASRTRVLSRDVTSRRARLLVLAVTLGIVLGLANLAANWLIASAHPEIRALLVQRFAALSPVVGVVAAPLMEEVAVRLFLMSAIGWLVSRFSTNPSAVFLIALWASALVFAVLHLGRPFPGDPALATFYRSALVAKYTLAGLPMGWLFWRWGLPYAIVCHALGNATHLVVQRFVF
jgi:membrane protease YdiL (CAAX protease family)